MKNINLENIIPEGSDLASRVSARKLRCIAEQAIEKGKKILADA